MNVTIHIHGGGADPRAQQSTGAPKQRDLSDDAAPPFTPEQLEWLEARFEGLLKRVPQEMQSYQRRHW